MMKLSHTEADLKKALLIKKVVFVKKDAIEILFVEIRITWPKIAEDTNLSI